LYVWNVNHHFLFSATFFQQIRRETADLNNLRATLSTIRDTWQYYLPAPSEWNGPTWKPSHLFSPDDVAQLRTYVVAQIFAYLELTYAPRLTHELFSSMLIGLKKIALVCAWCCPYSADIEGRTPPLPLPLSEDDNRRGIIPKGRNYTQQLPCFLRQHELDWGVLTNGRHWRLFHRTELSPTDTFLHIDLERIIASDDLASYIVFHRFFSQSTFARREGRQRLDLYKQQSDEAPQFIEAHLSTQV
jgi:hypothetical protein